MLHTANCIHVEKVKEARSVIASYGENHILVGLPAVIAGSALVPRVPLLL